MGNGHEGTPKAALLAARRERLRARQSQGFRVAPTLYNAQLLNLWVEHHVITEAVADSGDSQAIGLAVTQWWLRQVGHSKDLPE